MLTNNWYNIMAAVLCIGASFSKPVISTYGYSSTISPNTFMGNSNGGTYLGYCLGSKLTTQGNKSTSGVIFGTGSVAPTVNDTWLSGSLIGGLGISAACTAAMDNGAINKTVLYTITNNNSSNITISEIGYVGDIYLSNSGSYNYFLMDHTLLEEPLTIPPGGVGQITYTMPFNIGAIEA